MGQFLAMSGVVGGRESTVVEAVRAYATTHEGSLNSAQLAMDDDGCLIVCEGAGGVTVMYPGGFFDWDQVSENLSVSLQAAVFSFHIHDSDLWMYSLWDHGDEVDQFNPIPDYWGVLDDDESESWKGNAAEVARRVPGLSPDQISRYLVRWGDDVFEGRRCKAYPTDEFHTGEDWQLFDFMNKLGLHFPIDDRGEIIGTTYRFQCKGRFTV